MNQVVSKYDMTSRQLKDLVDVLRALNGTKQAPVAKPREQERLAKPMGFQSQDSQQSLAKLKYQSNTLND